MNGLKQLARVLGPKGLMPNLKSGTLVKPDSLIEAVKASKQGMIDFTDENLQINLDALLKSIA
jgi:ribosomal protein L1